MNEKVSRLGAGIEDLPTILSNAVEASLKNIDSLVQATADKIHRLTSLMEKLLYTEVGSKVSGHRQHFFIDAGNIFMITISGKYMILDHRQI